MKHNESNHYRPATLNDVDEAAIRMRDQHLDGIFTSRMLKHYADTAANEAKHGPGEGREAARSRALQHAAALAIQDRTNDVHIAQAKVFNAMNAPLLYEAAEREDAARAQESQETVQHIDLTVPASHTQHIPVQVGTHAHA